jgi:peptidoglycan/xylan/chitin deacetylase (PgdA/CDA1 family)
MGSTRAKAKELLRPAASRLIGSVYAARTDEPLVAFTFDDGPDERETPRILEALADGGARATFFILGERARRHPELVRLIRSAGHEIGSHSDVHRQLTALPLRDAAADIRRGKRDLEHVLGEPVRLFRPPFGFITRGGYLFARSLSLDVIAWSAEAKDWLELEVDELVANAFATLRPGGILLLHERHEPPQVPNPPPEPTFDRALLVRRLLEQADAKGWRSIPVGELLAKRPVDRRLWFRLPAPIA